MSETKLPVEIDDGGAWVFARALGWSLTVHRDLDPIDGDPFTVSATTRDDFGTSVTIRASGFTSAEIADRLFVHIPERYQPGIAIRLDQAFRAIAEEVAKGKAVRDEQS